MMRFSSKCERLLKEYRRLDRLATKYETRKPARARKYRGRIRALTGPFWRQLAGESIRQSVVRSEFGEDENGFSCVILYTDTSSIEAAVSELMGS